MGIEDKKSEGGEEVDQEAIRNIAVAVKDLIDQDKEKGKTTQDLGTVKKEVGELKGELGKIKEGMHCDPSGRYCFRTPEELSDWMIKQGEKMDGVESKIGEIATQVKGLGETGKKQALPPGVQRLPDVTAEIRAGMSEMDNEARDLEVKAIADYFRVSDNDLYRRVEKNPVNLDVIAKKQSMRERVLNTVTDEERKKMVLYGCKDGKCKVWREDLEKSEGVKFYLKDERGRFIPADQPKPEPSRI